MADDSDDEQPLSSRDLSLVTKVLHEESTVEESDDGYDGFSVDQSDLPAGLEVVELSDFDPPVPSSSRGCKRQRIDVGDQLDPQETPRSAFQLDIPPGELPSADEGTLQDVDLLPQSPMRQSAVIDVLLQDQDAPLQEHLLKKSTVMSTHSMQHADVAPNDSRAQSPVDIPWPLDAGDAASSLIEDDVSPADSEDEFGPDYFWDFRSDDEATSEAYPMTLSSSEDGLSDDEDSQHDQSIPHPAAATVPNVPLYTGAPINQLESVTAILAFMQSESISGAGFGRLLSLIDLHLPKPNTFLKSNARLFKVLGGLDDPVHIHYFCNICYKIRKDASDMCDFCTDESKTVLYFITFPLEPQLRTMFARPGFVQNLDYPKNRLKKNDDNIEDIYDGSVYKEAASRFSDSCLNITFMWNSDGMQVFKSNTFSLWPFYLVINELDPKKRFESENLLIAGLWGSVVKPHPNLYLLPIYKDLKSFQEGIEMKCHGEDQTRKVVAKVLCGTCDAPARASFLNMKQHSGFFSCPACLIKGVKPGDATVFPYQEDVTLRNIPQYETHVRWAVEHKVILLSKTVGNEEMWCGIKGPTVLSSMVPNMFDSTAIDALHCVYLGIMRQMLHLWTDKEHKERDFSVVPRLKIVNDRLRRLAPPHFLQRVPQSLDKLIYWKGTELRSFLFNLSLIILQDVLNETHFNHFALFVKGVALLNSASISEVDLVLSSLLLQQFVAQFSDLYGLQAMSHNVHMALHLERCVRLLGPLWALTCFTFEDINGRLANFIHGTRHVGLQIISNLKIVTKLPVMVQELREGMVKDYCKGILKKRYRLRVKEKISTGLYCVGTLRPPTDNQACIVNALTSQGIVSPDSRVLLFHRLLKHGMLYVSNCYNRGQRISSYVKYTKADTVCYGDVQCFVQVTCLCPGACACEKNYYAVVKLKDISPLEITGVEMTHLFQLVSDDVQNDPHYDVVRVIELRTVLFKIKVAGHVYLAEPLNDFELE